MPQAGRGGRQHNLPSELSSFVGREEAVLQTRRLLAEGRLVTLSGPGGIGKTRVALAVAESVLFDYPDGVWLIEFASLRSGDHVPQQVAATLGLRERPDQPLLQTLIGAVSRSVLLLVLDNCEHVLASCAQLAHALLRAAPDVSILCTSREPLGLRGEHVWRVAGLGFEAHVPAVLSDAVQLFVERAQSVAQAFEITEANRRVVDGICQSLDGIPLAIELAAAHARALSAVEIAEQLENRFRLLTSTDTTVPDRQRTLRATFDWSYDLLSEPERRVFERLAVFVDGWTVEAASAVCASGGTCTDDTPTSDDVIDLLTRLVDKSMVVRDAGSLETSRFRFLVTLREYAFEQLLRHGDLEATQDQHAAHFLMWSERLWLDPRVLPGRMPVQELGNLRAALERLIERGDYAAACALGGRVRRLWIERGFYREGLAWMQRLLELPAAERTPNRRGDTERVQVLLGAAFFANRSGMREEGLAYIHQLLRLSRDIGDRASESVAHYWLGEHARLAGDLEGAEQEYLAGIDAGKDAFDRARREPARGAAEYGVLLNTEYLLLLRSARDPAAARARLEQLRDRAIAARQPTIAQHAGLMLGRLLYQEGDYAAAQQAMDSASTDLAGDSTADPLTRTSLGMVALHTRTPQVARALLAEGLVSAYEIGMPEHVAEALLGFAGLASACGDAECALRLDGAATALNRELGKRNVDFQTQFRRRFITPLSSRVGPARAKTLARRGRKLTLEQAVSEALAVSVPPGEASDATQPGTTRVLSPRELEVATLIKRGFTNRGIAEELVIAPSTAERHVANILGKLELNSRTQLAIWAHDHLRDGS